MAINFILVTTYLNYYHEAGDIGILKLEQIDTESFFPLAIEAINAKLS